MYHVHKIVKYKRNPYKEEIYRPEKLPIDKESEPIKGCRSVCIE